MLVILKEDIPHLGEIGDVIKVSAGYARNFLIPRRLVAQADKSNVAQLEHHKRILEKKREERRTDAQSLAEKLEGQSFTFNRKVGKNDKLFGSVTSADIAEQLQAAGFKVEKSEVVLGEPLKALGEHSVRVKLHSSITANAKIIIEKEEE